MLKVDCALANDAAENEPKQIIRNLPSPSRSSAKKSRPPAPFALKISKDAPAPRSTSLEKSEKRTIQNGERAKMDGNETFRNGKTVTLLQANPTSRHRNAQHTAPAALVAPCGISPSKARMSQTRPNFRQKRFVFDKEVAVDDVSVRRPDLAFDVGQSTRNSDDHSSTWCYPGNVSSLTARAAPIGQVQSPTKEFRLLRDEVGHKVALKFRRVRDAFRFVDADKDGIISRTEIRHFFRTLNIDEARADRFFDSLDVNGSGEVDYLEFKKFFGAIIQPDYGYGRGDDFGYPSGSKTARHGMRFTPRQPAAFADSLNQIYCPRLKGGTLHVSSSIPEDLRKVCYLIGEKAPQKFRTVREAFRFIDTDHDGLVSQAEMHGFFRAFNIPPEMADKMFQYLDKDHSNHVDYNEFVHHFGQYIQPGYRLERDAVPVAEVRARFPVGGRPNIAVPDSRKELDKILRVITEKAAVKWRLARDCFRYVDTDHNGFVTRDEVRGFLGTFSLPHYTADLLFKALDTDNDGKVNYNEFVDYFAPHIQPGGIVKTVRK
eukprot:GEMP01009243.1.p1 GENE.GEMP01009243.1~~GEMP01009243.1.p1  ORF type:complete len:545 (+),score=80.84 GEMP01009243.1:39-1673(+)